jgi:hypothetical protein
MKLEIDPVELKPLIEQIVAETVAHAKLEQTDGRLAYTEPEAAEKLGVPPHVLRDARLRGEISPSGLGSRILYSRESLMDYLRNHQWRDGRVVST